MQKKMGFVILFCVVAIALQAMPSSVASREYTPRFMDWVLLWFNVNWAEDNDDFILVFGPDFDRSRGESKIHIWARVHRNEKGRFFMNNRMPQIYDNIERYCEFRRAEGYEIKYPDDFIIDVEFMD